MGKEFQIDTLEEICDLMCGEPEKEAKTMTKKEMMYEIISNTKLSGLNENNILRTLAKLKKSRVEEVYNVFVNDKEHALFYYNILVCNTL